MALEVLTAAVPSHGRRLGRPHPFQPDQHQPPRQPMRPADYAGRYVNYGVREHAMVAAMNGMAVHGGVIPYGGTFLVFADYCRPALRLAALMRQRVIFVATHDSIGLGEDGPTHQPVEHLASLRAIPNMLVFRPADAVETAECWELALRQQRRPVRPGADPPGPADAARPAHRREPLRPRRLRAAPRPTSGATSPSWPPAPRCIWRWRRARCSAAEGIAAAVVSMPCWELFERQDPAYRAGRAGHRAARRGRGGLAVRLDALRRQRGRRGRHDAASAPAARSSSCTSISASRPSTSRARRARCSAGRRSQRERPS